MTEVAAALIRDEEGRIFIFRRPQNKKRGGLWEFAGGKLEPGETGPEALVRECREELDVTVSVGQEYCAVTHRYPDLEIRLTLYEAAVSSGTIRLLEHTEMKRVLPEELAGFEFCPADEEILRIIREREGERR